MLPSISPSRYRSSLPVSSPRITTDLPMWPTSARVSGKGLEGSFGGVTLLGALAATGVDAGCAGCDGLNVIGRLSSGRAFHILAPISFSFCVELIFLSPALHTTPVALGSAPA